jgi:hypothetical protein
VIHDGLHRSQPAIRFEGKIESDDCRNANRGAGDDSNESLAAQTPADKLIDYCARQRSKDD